jgi:uncharacterized protein (TIGR03084 family)
MTDRLSGVLGDVATEAARLDALVAPLGADGWARPTPAPGWSVAHQIAHLAWTDEMAVLAATDRRAWDVAVEEAIEDATGFVDKAADRGAAAPHDALLERWRSGRERLAGVLGAVPDGERLPWFGPPMSAMSMATARFMETWAHGRDVAAGLGATLPADDAVRHVVHLGVRTRDFAFANSGMQPPERAFRVELRLPSGAQVEYGHADSPETVSGSAYDFALLVTQRAHRRDLDLRASGTAADRWLDIAQAFAGPAGAGRAPRGAA